MNILIILDSLPYPLNSGGKQGVFSCIDVIKDYHKIHVTCYNDRSTDALKELCNLWPNVKLLPFYEDRKDSPKYYLFKKVIKVLFRNFFKKNKYRRIDDMLDLRLNHFNPQYYSFINDIIEKYKIEVVQCEFLSNMKLLYSLPLSVKTVFVHHEIGFVKNEQLINEMKTPKHYGNYIAELLKKDEIDTLSRYNAIITHSTIDTQKLIEAGVKTKLFTSFSMVKINHPKMKVENFSKVLTFVGPESHFPNKSGLEWFLEKVWGNIEKKGYTLKIIGKWSEVTSKKWKRKYESISFEGFVEDLAEVLRGSIMIVPIFIGSGIRMKLQEAAYLGIPFVSTTIGVEGLPFKNQVDCLISDTSNDFANAIIQMSDIEVQRKFADQAYKTITTYFSKEKLRESRLVVYRELQKNNNTLS